MSSYKCLTCGATVFGDSFGRRFICSTCEQTEAIKKQGELDRQAADQRADEQRYQYAQEQHLAREAMYQQQISARLDREATVNAILEAAKYSAEAGQSANDVYQYALNYIANEWASGVNPHKLQIYFDEDCRYQYFIEDPPYLTPHLISAFNKGIQETIDQWTLPTIEYFKDSVNSAGEHGLNCFYVPWAVPETGHQIKSVTYTPNLSINIDPTDGEVTYTFNDVFRSAELNNIYRSGIRKKERNSNSLSDKHERLKIVQDYQKEKKKKELKNLAHYITIEMWPVWLVFLILFWLFS
jgi:DNA-directed RNA polymerase subunit RPC12/RpoP